jgi:hypothetical protein
MPVNKHRRAIEIVHRSASVTRVAGPWPSGTGCGTLQQKRVAFQEANRDVMLALTLVQVWLTIGPPIQRPSEGVPLRWEAPLECPDETALRERVHALVPGLLERPDAAGSRVEVVVRAAAESHAATVVVRNDDGETRREFAAPDCETVVDAAALVVAVALDPVGVSVGLSEPAASEPTPTEPTESNKPIVREEPAAEPEPLIMDEPIELPPAIGRASDPPTDERPRNLGFGVRVLGGGGYGPTNTGYATIGGTLALLGPRWRVELGGLWAIPRVVRDDAGLGGRFDGWAVVGRGCFAPNIRRLELPSCGGVELGSVRGRGLEELPISGRASFLWIALAVAQGLWFSPIERVGIGLEIDLAVPLNRGVFAIETSDVQRIAAVTVRGLAGVELRW